MTATEHFHSIDTTLATIRETHAREMQTLKDELLGCQMEAQMHRDAATRAIEARAAAERITAGLLAQFGTVSVVFEQAKKMALEAGFIDPDGTPKPAEGSPPTETPIPENQL